MVLSRMRSRSEFSNPDNLLGPYFCDPFVAICGLVYRGMLRSCGLAHSRSKNAAKNAKKKAKAAAAKKAAAEQAAAAGANGAREERVEMLQEPGDTPAPAPAPSDPAKEAKKIQKKLRQIEQLEEKQAGGTKLEDTQLAKLATKADLEAQLAALGV